MTSASFQREHLRQQMLLRSLWKDNSASSLQGWLAQQRPDGGRRPNQRAWQAYVASAHANAERALAACFPTVQQLLGEESFAAMARDYWHHSPPQRGDMAWLGEGLPAFISRNPQLSSEPYLADVAHLEWALNRCEAAEDAPPDVTTLALLAEHDAQALRLSLAPGAAVISSTHPIVSIWQAHHEPADANDPFAAVRAAFALELGEHALVWRQEWRARVRAVDLPTARFLKALLDGQSLACALEVAGYDWDFEAWLHAAVPSGLFGRITFN
ncbi:MAG: putative DNA-binding domain-containing protein [Burkholderiales bacterium]